MQRFKTVDDYIESSTEWKDCLIHLRKILNSTKLDETVKWGAPCYTFDGKNVVGIGAFKAYCGLWFYQGALLADEENVLINAQEGKTKAMRQWRFKNKKEIKSRSIKAYITEAISLVQSGKEIKPNRSKPVVIPPELQTAFRSNKKLHNCFKEMTPGKQREYADYIADCKREETKTKRLEKIMPMILDKQGLNDKYRNC